MAERNKLTCQQVRDLAGSERYSPAVLSHIQECDRCLDLLLGVLMHDQAAEVPHDFARRLLAQTRPPERSGTPLTAFGVCGASLFAIGVGWYRPELIALAQTIDGVPLLAAMSAQAMFIIVFVARWTRV
jgi:hypothetical protein